MAFGCKQNIIRKISTYDIPRLSIGYVGLQCQRGDAHVSLLWKLLSSPKPIFPTRTAFFTERVVNVCNFPSNAVNSGSLLSFKRAIRRVNFLEFLSVLAYWC